MAQTEIMVKNLVEKFQEQGLNILYAQCNGYEEPTKVQGVSPDVVGWDPDREMYHLGVVADSEIISSDFIKEKMSILANMMMGVGSSEGKRLPFYLGVPKEASDTAHEKLKENNLALQENIQTIEV